MAEDKDTHESKGIVGLGTKVFVKVEDDFILIGEPKDISGPQISQEFADFTHMQSPMGYREQKATWKTSGTVTFNVNRVTGDPGQEALIEAMNSVPCDILDFKLEFPDKSTFSFKAYPTCSFNVPMSNAFEMSVTLNVTGPVFMDDGSDEEDEG